MPTRMTPEQKAHYETLSKNEKTRYTMLLRSQAAKSKGRKNPYGPQEAAREQLARQAKKEAESLNVSKIQGKLAAALAKHELDPIEELIRACKRSGPGSLKLKEKIALYKFLVPYITPQLKSVDIQQDLKMNVSVEVRSYRDATQEALREGAVDVDLEEYAEFDESTEEEADLLVAPTHEAGV